MASSKTNFISYLLAVLVIVAAGCTSAMAQGQGQQWVGTWTGAPQPAAPLDSGFAPAFAGGFNYQTIRNIVHTSVGGDAVRVRITNAFGTQSVTFDAVYVGIPHAGATLLRGSNHALRFGGSASVTIPAGAETWSDPLPFNVPADGNLAISLFAASATVAPTVHLSARATTYVAEGDAAALENGSAFAAMATSWYFVNGVDVLASPRVKGAVVAFGDSITDADGSTMDANTRWPNYLARRFLAGPAGLQMSVLDEGVSANRLLTDSPCFARSALNRLDADVLRQTGVRYVILMEGLNDIGFPVFPFSFVCLDPNHEVSVDQIIAGYQEIIARVHANGLKIFAGTLPPFKGVWYWTPQGEAKRQALNAFIKSSAAFDGVIDFAAVLADSSDPTVLAAQFNSGDNIHPNDAGNEAMANAIDLAQFVPRR